MSRTFTDAQLIEALPMLRAFAIKLAWGSPAMVDDLVQTAAVKALANAHQYRPGTNFRAWMATILRNEFFNQARAIKRRPTVDIEEATWIGRPGNQEDAVYLRQASRAADSLPREQQAAILASMLGLTIEEAARVLGIPEGTAKSRISRARSAVAAQVEEVAT